MIDSVQPMAVKPVVTETNLNDSNSIVQCTDMEEFAGKRRRSSSMDILAEAASATCTASTYSGQTSRASEDWDDELEHKREVSIIVDGDIHATRDNVNDSSSSSTFNISKRPRSATFSYSPFTSKDPDLMFSPKSGEKFRALNWIANFHEDEHTTADLLSNLSQFKVRTHNKILA